MRHLFVGAAARDITWSSLSKEKRSRIPLVSLSSCFKSRDIEGVEVGVLEEQAHPPHATVEDVKQHSARR
jgi:hypothetical protein